MNYWEDIVDKYQQENHISCDDFHYGPLIHGDSFLKLLPTNLKDLNCLEIACGGAQNSIFLAKHAAKCTALDASASQINYAKDLAQKNNVEIDFRVMSMDELEGDFNSFDLIHSAYGLNFASDFNNIIEVCANLLSKDGILLFSLPHPLFSGEFLELDGEIGLFLKEYLSISPDLRFDDENNKIAESHFYSLDEISSVLAKNNLSIERLCEGKVCKNPPYTSDTWESYRPQLSQFPGTIIIKAVRM